MDTILMTVWLVFIERLKTRVLETYLKNTLRFLKTLLQIESEICFLTWHGASTCAGSFFLSTARAERAAMIDACVSNSGCVGLNIVLGFCFDHDPKIINISFHKYTNFE